MSMARGMADAMVSGRAAAAESDAAFAANRASKAEARASGARIRAARAEQEAAGWKAEAERMTKLCAERAADASAGLIVMNAFIKYMETMPVQEREKLRQFVAHASLKRMRELDADVEFRKRNPLYPSIETSFKGLAKQNDYLKIA